MPVPNGEIDRGNLEKKVVPCFPSPHLEQSVRGNAVSQHIQAICSLKIPWYPPAVAFCSLAPATLLEQARLLKELPSLVWFFEIVMTLCAENGIL
jgi:hypothetical protein